MSGKLIVFEGTDGSGKATQAKLLCETLAQRGLAYREIDFPRYGNPFAEPANLYLHGALGNHPGDVNAYAASVLYAVDRFASYKEDWGRFYEEGGIVVANRYTTSNAVHQASKLPEGERREFLDWLFDLEYHRMGLPEPDLRQLSGGSSNILVLQNSRFFPILNIAGMMQLSHKRERNVIAYVRTRRPLPESDALPKSPLYLCHAAAEPGGILQRTGSRPYHRTEHLPTKEQSDPGYAGYDGRAA